MNYIVDFSLHIQDIPPDAFRLRLLDCQNDGINQNFVFHLECYSQNSYDISDWGLKKAVIYYKNKPFRSGILTAGKAYAEEDKKFKESEGYFYEFKLSSPLAYFKTRGPNRVCVNKSANQIIDEVLDSAGWKKNQWRWNIKNPLPELLYVVQYHQSDYDFFMGLCEEFKLNFIFELELLKISDDLQGNNIIHHVEEHSHYYTETLPELLGYEYEKSPRAGLFTAKIEALDSNKTYINYDGYYVIRFLFDETSELLQGSKPVALIAPHFMHFPLRANTNVAIRFIEGNMREPIIVGVIPDKDPDTNIYNHTSYLGHEVKLEDSSLKLTHADTKNFIELAEDIKIFCGKGEFSGKSGSQIIFNAQGDFIQDIQQDQSINITQSHTIKTKMGHIIFQANNMAFSAEQELKLTSRDNIDIQGDKILLTAPKIIIKTQENMQLNTSQKLEIFSQEINIESGSELMISVNGVSILGTSGGMVLNTPVLTINALQISGIQMM